MFLHPVKTRDLSQNESQIGKTKNKDFPRERTAINNFNSSPLLTLWEMEPGVEGASFSSLISTETEADVVVLVIRVVVVHVANLHIVCRVVEATAAQHPVRTALRPLTQNTFTTKAFLLLIYT